MKNLNDSPARYAAQLAEPIGSLHRHLAAEQPDWWRQVVAELEKRLEQEFPETFHCEDCGAALYAAFATCEDCGCKFNQGADVIPPWKGGSAPETPDWLPGMEYARINAVEARIELLTECVGNMGPSLNCAEHNADLALDRAEILKKRIDAWEQRAALSEQRFDGIETRLGTIESLASRYRLNALEERLSALEDWADIGLEPVDDTEPDSIHKLIAEAMTIVTVDCGVQIAAAVAPLLARIESLENRAPC